MEALQPVIEYLRSLAPQIVTLVSLIALDVVMGIAAALREKVFRWREVGDFYLTMVLPFLLGWIAFSVVSHFAVVELLGPQYGGMVGPVITWAAWMAVVAVLGNSIIRNAKTLYGEFPPRVADDLDGQEG
jgi:hypothetical protein